MSMREPEPGTGSGPAADEDLEDELTDSVPKVVPAYADEELRELGERLANLYHSRDMEPESDDVRKEIDHLRSRMRKGPRLHAGEFLQDGRLRLLERLPGGGGDAYWKAWDRRLGVFVFVRVFHGEWVTDRKAVKAFLERGAALKALDHPGVGQVLEADRSDDGFLYLATRFFDSGSLQAAAGLQPIDALQIGVEVALALRFAHEHDVVHGDVRPANVMLSQDHAAHLVGFSVEPKEGDMGGSLFRAPEATERGYQPRPASDVYALGMTLIQALHGSDLPFWVLRDPARLIRALPVSDPVKAVLQKATDWDLAVRYPDIPSMLDDLLADPELVEALATRARDLDRHPVAAEHFETLLRIQPQRAVEIRRILGDVYTAMGSYDSAFHHLLAALERTGDVESFFPPLRVVASRTGDWGRLAEALWTQARARDAGRRVILRTELARINQEELRNPIAAAETWSQVLADHRTPAQARNALRALQGLARAREDWAAFVEYGKELLDYVDEDQIAEVEYAIGRALLEHLDDEDQGLSFIDRAEARGHTEVDLAPRLQGIRARRQQWQRVIQLMTQQAATQEISEASPTLLRAGIIASSVHLEEEAFKVYHALLERAPRHVVALRHLARLHHRAHEYELARRFYDKIWEAYKGKDAEEPEASERAADNTASATLLLKLGQTEDALERLEEALRLNPNHVPSLQLAGPLLLGKGDTARAGAVFDRLLSLFKSVELSPQKIEACLGMGDLAWVQGRLTAAMGWYNRAIELDPFSVRGWWGLAKVALSARGGHPGADRAPWVMAMPKRTTAHEALARLLAGTIDATALRAWLERTPLGRAVLDGGDTPMRLACVVVDVMERNEVIAPELFQRLGDAFPDWHDPIDLCHRLWFGGTASSFLVARSYGWSRRSLSSDFDPLEHRSMLPPELAPPAVAHEDLRSPDSWRALLSGPEPAPPEAFTMIEPREDTAPIVYPGPVGALVRDGQVWVALTREQLEVSIGSGVRNDLRIPEDSAVREHHARLFRQGGRVYVQTLADGRVQVDGDDRNLWRLVGGERITIGDTRLQYQAYDDESRLPRERRPAPGAPPPGRPVHLPLDEFEAPDEATDGSEPIALPSVTDEVPLPSIGGVAAVEPDEAPAEGEGAGDDAPEAEEAEPLVEPASEEVPRPEPEPEFDPMSEESPIPESPPAPIGEEPDDDEPPGQVVAELPRIEMPKPSRPEPVLEVWDTSDVVVGDQVETSQPIDDEDLSENEPETRAEPEPMTELHPPVMPEPVTGPLPADVVAEADEDELGDEPPSEEEVIDARSPMAPAIAISPMADLMDGDGPSEDGAHAPRDPDTAEQAIDALVDEDDEERAETEFVGPTSPATPPDLPDDEPSDPLPDVLPSAPSWLREALAAEEAGTGEEAEPAAAEEAPAEAPPAEEAPAEEAPAEEAPAEPENVPTVIASAVGLGPIRLDEPPVKGGETTTTGVFSFPEELRSDDVDALATDAMALGKGVSGPTMVPMERQQAPSQAPPASSLFMPVRTPAPGQRQPEALVEFMLGPERGRSVPVTQVLTIGQSRHCGMSIPGDSRLSPVHCRIERTGYGFVLRDEGSANGTVVNGQRVTEVELAGGEVIMVGRTVLRFRVEEE